MKPGTVIVGSIAIVIVGACSAGVGDQTAVPTNPPSAQVVTTVQPEELPTPVNEPSGLAEGVAAVVELATADLADHLNVDEGAIEVVSVQPVTWPDGSLGCPQPGEVYTQALVDGYKVVLGTNGRTRVYIYTAGADGQPFLCPSDERDGGHDFVPPPGIDY